MWTLKVNSTEKTLANWGITADFEIGTFNKEKSTVRFRTTERFDPGAPAIASRDRGWLYRDRTAVGSGGTLVFQGYFDSPKRTTHGGRENIEYLLHDILWLFGRNAFKQHRKQFNGWNTPGDPSSGLALVDKVCPEIFLGEKTDGSLLTGGGQIQEVIDWMNESYNPTRRGATSGMDATQDVVAAGTLNPQWKLARSRVNTIFCIEAMNSIMRWMPGAIYVVGHGSTIPTLSVLSVAKWNYATDPPTFIDYTNLPEVTIDITAAQEKEISVQAVDELKLPGVIIYYATTSTVDGETVPIQVIDKYPPGISEWLPETSNHFVELIGYKLNRVKAEIKTSPVAPAVTGSAAERAAWWRGHDTTLSDPRIDADTISAEAATVVDDSGAAVDLDAYPNELLPTSAPLPKWARTKFGLVVKHVTVKATIAYEQFADTDHNITEQKVVEKAARHSIKVTNAVTRTYSTVKNYDSGEAIPQGVAESVYRAAAVTQHAGKITFADAQLRSDIYMGCRLKLVGPNTTFSNVIPQSIIQRPHYGTTEVSFGPAARVDAEGLIELARASRLRLIYNMPSGRADGGMGADNATDDETADAPSENTAHGIGGQKFTAVTFQRD